MKRFRQVVGTLLLLVLGNAYGDDVSVRILGSGGPGYNAERAEAAVLVRFGDVKFLVDMGNGTLAGLSKAAVRPGQLAALFITHHHIDHNQELIPVFASALLGRNAPTVVGPAGTQTQTDFASTFYRNDVAYRRANIGIPGAAPHAEVREVKGGEEFTLHGIAIKTLAVNHSVETIAYRFEKDGKSVVVSGDLYYSESLVALAQNVDILVIDGGPVSIPRGRTIESTKARPRSHSTFDEIIAMLAKANAKTVVLNHLPARAINETAVRDAITHAGIRSQIVFAYDGLEL